MNYKLESALKKGKTTIIVAGILWLLLAIVFIMPWTCGIYTKTLLGEFNMDSFLTVFMSAVTNPGKGFKTLAERGIILNYIKNLFGFSLFYIIVVIIGIFKMMPKHRYDDIEHGSSDWSENGEQYKVLSKKSGIISYNC